MGQCMQNEMKINAIKTKESVLFTNKWNKNWNVVEG